MSLPSPAELRARLADARLLLVFTPELTGDRDPLAALEAAAPFVDVVQVRPKPLATAMSGGVAADPPGEARATCDWTVRVLDLVWSLPEPRPLVMVNDRVDVARLLVDRGCAGVHLGRDDLPVDEARKVLGPEPLIGYSTHSLDDVVRAERFDADYLGFGPVFRTVTKGYERGLGPESAWVADQGAGVPLFPIGGIDVENADELQHVGRAAVGSAVMSAPDPGEAARVLREMLAEGR